MKLSWIKRSLKNGQFNSQIYWDQGSTKVQTVGIVLFVNVLEIFDDSISDDLSHDDLTLNGYDVKVMLNVQLPEAKRWEA